MKTAEEILEPYVERVFSHTNVVDKDNALKAMEEYGQQFRLKSLDVVVHESYANMTPFERIMDIIDGNVKSTTISKDNPEITEINRYAASCLLGFLGRLKSTMTNELKEQDSIMVDKAKKWDDLHDKIAAYYDNDSKEYEGCSDRVYHGESDDEIDGSLLEIGETAAIAFGFL